MIILNFIRGMFMAFADSVPGVSGGTIAFIMGFYGKFIGSINTLLSRSTKAEKKEALIFLIKIGVGWVFGLLTSILFIASIFEKHIYNISSLFLGFILFSIPLIYKEEKDTVKGNYLHFIYLFIGIAVVSLITYFNPVGGTDTDTTALSLSFGHAIYVFIAGMIAISAMVLPGISGSTLLLIFGLYNTIITGIKDVLHFNFAPLPILIIFGLGVLVGIVSVVRGLDKLLKTKRSQMIYLIFGLMIGSLYAVVMGPTTLDNPVAPLSIQTFNVLFFIIGGLVILGLEAIKRLIKE